MSEETWDEISSLPFSKTQNQKPVSIGSPLNTFIWSSILLHLLNESGIFEHLGIFQRFDGIIIKSPDSLPPSRSSRKRLNVAKLYWQTIPSWFNAITMISFHSKWLVPPHNKIPRSPTWWNNCDWWLLQRYLDNLDLENVPRDCEELQMLRMQY